MFTIDTDLCLKYYRTARYRVRYVMIVLVELRCTDCTNKLLKQRILAKTLTDVTSAR